MATIKKNSNAGLLIGVLLLLVFGPGSLLAGARILPPDSAKCIVKLSDGTYARPAELNLLMGRASSARSERSFIQWNLTDDIIPDGSTIDSAKLRFDENRFSGSVWIEPSICRIDYDLRGSTPFGTLYEAPDLPGAPLFHGTAPVPTGGTSAHFEQLFAPGLQNPEFLNWIHDQLPQNRLTLCLKVYTDTRVDNEYQIQFLTVTLSIWYTSPVQSVRLDQLWSTGQSHGSIAHWEGNSFINYVAPDSFLFDVSSHQTFRADTGLATNPSNGATEKYKDWNSLPNVVNHQTFLILQGMGALVADFAPTNDAGARTALIDAANVRGGLDFQDPWLIDSTDNLYGNSRFNRGPNAVFRTLDSSQNNIGKNTIYRGVLLNQSGPPFWAQPYYSVRAPLTTPIANGLTGYFQDWSYDTNQVKLKSLRSNRIAYDSEAVVFNQPGATLTARYKAHLGSGNPNATRAGGQRRINEDLTDGHVKFAVYESGGEIWAMTSLNHAPWSNEVRLTSGNGGNAAPSLTSRNGYAYAAWEHIAGTQRQICLSKYSVGQWRAPMIVFSYTDVVPGLPVIGLGDTPLAIIIHYQRGAGSNARIYRTVSQTDGISWATPQVALPFDNNPATSLSIDDKSTSPSQYFAGAYESNRKIYGCGTYIPAACWSDNILVPASDWVNLSGEDDFTMSSSFGPQVSYGNTRAYYAWMEDQTCEYDHEYVVTQSYSSGWSTFKAYEMASPYADNSSPTLGSTTNGLSMTWSEGNQLKLATVPWNS